MSNDAASRLHLTVFGPPEVVRADGTAVTLRARKHLALLIYLAIEQRRSVSRDTLVALLWPETGEEAARNNLRVALADLRRLLGEADPPWLHTTRHTVQFAPHSPHTLDVLHFRALLDAAHAHAHPALETCTACLARLEQAVTLYGGEFLAGFSLPDSSTWDEWALLERERLHQAALDALQVLATAYERKGDYAAQCRAARRQIALEPWREVAHMQLMRGLWGSGQRGAALAQYDGCVRILADELGIEPGAATTALYTAMKGGTWQVPDTEAVPTQPVGVDPPPAPATDAATNLPTPLTPCIGRDAELADLLALARSPDVRLVTLLGVGGIGKTHLSLELGRARGHEFADGVVFVQLAPLGAPSAIAPAILAALGIAAASGDPSQMLVQVLRAKQMLLILDNFEHLLHGADIVTDILQRAPQVEVVVTSRERLQLRGEHPYRLDGLAYAQQATLADAADAAAVRVFVLNAKRVDRTFKLHEHNVEAVLRICQLVDGLPLGLELAAAWVESLGPTEIAAEIERSADFLAWEWRDLPERHHSIRAVFAWSWRLLNDTEQRVVRGFSVFRGGCTREAAQTVIDAPLRTLTRLTHTSMLRWVPTPSGAGCYEMHPLLREFAAEQLDAVPDERAAVEARHANYYLQLVGQAAAALQGQQPLATAGMLRESLDNIRQAWRWAAEHGQWALLGDHCFALTLFYRLLGLLHEGAELVGLAADQVQRLAGKQPLIAGRLLGLQGGFLELERHYAQAIQVVQAAQAHAQRAGDTLGEALAARVWGGALYTRSTTALPPQQLRAAREHLERAITLCQNTGADDVADRRWRHDLEAESNSLFTMVLAEQGDEAAARTAGERALQLCRASGNRFGEVLALTAYGELLKNAGWFNESSNYHEQALHLARAIGASEREAIAHVNIAEALLYGGDVAGADTHAHAALHLYQSLGLDPSFIQHLLSWVAYHRGAYAEALASAQMCVEAVRASDDRAYLSEVLLSEGDALSGLDRWGEAEAAYHEARTLAQDVGSQSVVATALARLAPVALAQGQPDRALAHAEAALALLETVPPVVRLESLRSAWACYQVLAANDDARAVTVLTSACQQLLDYAANIGDTALRRSFLENVATHRELLRELHRSRNRVCMRTA